MSQEDAYRVRVIIQGEEKEFEDAYALMKHLYDEMHHVGEIALIHNQRSYFIEYDFQTGQVEAKTKQGHITVYEPLSITSSLKDAISLIARKAYHDKMHEMGEAHATQFHTFFRSKTEITIETITCLNDVEQHLRVRTPRNRPAA